MTAHAWSHSCKILPPALVLVMTACAAVDPYGRNLVVPEGTIFEEPAEAVAQLGFQITHVDTIIGYIDAYRLRGGLDGEADRMLVDVFTAPTTGRRVVTITAQTLEDALVVGPRAEVTGRSVTPSADVRQAAAAVLERLGCDDVLSEQRMTPDGIDFDVWCAGDQRPGAHR